MTRIKAGGHFWQVDSNFEDGHWRYQAFCTVCSWSGVGHHADDFHVADQNGAAFDAALDDGKGHERETTPIEEDNDAEV